MECKKGICCKYKGMSQEQLINELIETKNQLASVKYELDSLKAKKEEMTPCADVVFTPKN